MSNKKIIIESYNEEWEHEFIQTGILLREALGDIATRIDHIGSTSIIGLYAFTF